MKLKCLIFALALFGFGMSAYAQTATPRVTAKQFKQSKRIKHGVVNGELTKKETVGLIIQQKHIQHAKVRAKADGTVTPFERSIIARKQKRASRNIYIQKHDHQDRH